MERLVGYLLRRFAPKVGWPLALLTLAAASCPALAATEGALALPAGLIFWAGLGGALLGLRAARAPRRLRYLLGGPLALAIGALLVVAGGRALPPLTLVLGDLTGSVAALARWAQGGLGAALPPESLAWRFLASALPRLWQELLAAPADGERGAALLVGTAALTSTWIGALCLGWAIGAERAGGVASLPLLVALATTTILSGSAGAALVIGMALLLSLAVAARYLARERAWDRAGVAYSEELRWGLIGAGFLGASGIISLALALPTAIPRPLAEAFWPAGELPSGLAAIDRQVQRGASMAAATVGLSELPAVQLGISLEQAPPETLVLRISTGGPLADTAWPRYWRARLLTRYDGRRWWADARVSPFGAPLRDVQALPEGVIVQEVEDLRQNATLLVALPNALGLDIQANAERLPDGSLAALTRSAPGGRYRAFSLPQELASPLDGSAVPPPDLSASLAVPAALPPRVRELAETIAGQKATALEQALALEGYLRKLPYSYSVRPLPRDGDAVDQFLFEMREGYCTYYASAMVIMARSLGIPARVALGYATGSYDPATAAYTVREAEAHAWPELLIAGRWLPFEPTPIRQLPARSPAPQAAAPSPTTAAEPPATALPAWASPTLLLVGLGGAALALALGGWLIVGRRRSPLAQAQRSLERLGARAGLAWPAGATLHEYMRLIEGRSGGESRPLRELVALIEQARYGGRALDAGQIRRLRQAQRVCEAWARRPRAGG